LQTSYPSLIGAERPRVEVRPPSSDTLGDVAVELSTRAGLAPEPWQAEGLRLMMSLRPDGKWTAYEYAELLARQNGKTGGLLAPRALTGLLVLDERLIMWSAHLYATAMESFRLVRSMLMRLGEVTGPNLIDVDGIPIKVSNTNGDEGFERLDTGARLKFLARSKSSGRGFTGDCNLLDEAFAFTRAQQSALMPTMTAVPNAQVVYASTPPLDRWSGEVLFGLRKRAESGGDGALAWRDWGLDTSLDDLERMDVDERTTFLDDRGKWAATNPALGRGRVTEESLLRNRRALSDEDFARECLGMWPVPAADAGGEIPPASWRAVADAGSQFEGRPAFGIDVPDDRTGASIELAARRADGRMHVEVFDDRAGIGWVVERCVELSSKADPIAFAVDPTSPAGSLVTEMRSRGLNVVEVTGREYVQACGEFFDAVIEDRVRHRDQAQLNRAASVAKRRDVGDGAWAWARRRSGADIRAIVGATLAYHVFLAEEARASAPSFAFVNLWGDD
jgi:hypothetical protein